VTTNESWRRYLEAGAAVGQVTLARAEGIARGLFGPDDDERETAWHDLDELTRFGRQMGDQLIDMARAEMSRHLETLGVGSLDQFLDRIVDLVRSQPFDAPSHSADPHAKPEPVVAATGPDATRSAEGKKAEKPQKESLHKGSKTRAKRTKATATMHADAGDPASERSPGTKHHNDKKHKQHKKHKKAKKDPAAGPRASGPNRLLTLAPPPESAGGI
jgi:hypothetical protein